MRRPLLVILAAAGGLVALLLIVVTIALWRVDPNDYIVPIQARIKQVTGRDATIRGGIDLKVSLTPRLVAHDAAPRLGGGERREAGRAHHAVHPPSTTRFAPVT